MHRPIEEAHAMRLSGAVVDRVPDELPPKIPICAKSIQHIHLSAGRCPPPQKDRIFMASWLITGRARMAMGARRIPIVPGEVAISLPTDSNRFWMFDSDNEICRFTADGPLAESFAMQLGIRAGVHTAASSPPIPLLNRIMDVLGGPSPDLYKASKLTVAAMYHVAQTIREPEMDQGVRRAQQIIHQHFANPELSADSIAVELNYHRGSLSRLFHKHTGVTIMEYLTRMRLERAKALLLQTDNKVTWIAEQCGFKEATYFCRWLRKQTGKTSRDFRVAEEREIEALEGER